MKFLLIILAIRLLVGVLTKKNKSDQNNVELMNENILHPAEFDLR